MRGSLNTQKRLLWLHKQYGRDPEVFIRAASIVGFLTASQDRWYQATPADALAHPEQLLRDLEVYLIDAPPGWLRSRWGQTIQGHGASPLGGKRAALTLDDYAESVVQSIRDGDYHEMGESDDLRVRNPYDRYAGWIGKVVNSLVKAHRKGTLKLRGREPGEMAFGTGEGYYSEEGDWIQDTRYLPLIQRLRLLVESMPQIRDWAEAERVNLMGLTYQQAKRRSNLWHRELEKQELAEGAEPGKVVFRFADGWTVQHLTKRAHLKQEGKALKHCVGATPVYWDAIQRGHSRILSLRDAQGVPQVTMEFQPPGALRSGRHGTYRVESPEDTPFPRWGLTQAKAFKNKRPPNQLADRIVYWLLRTVPEGKDLQAAGVDQPDLRKQSGWMVPNPEPGKAKVSLRHKALLLDRPPSPMIPHSGEPYPVEWIEILEEHYPWAQP